MNLCKAETMNNQKGLDILLIRERIELPPTNTDKHPLMEKFPYIPFKTPPYQTWVLFRM